MVLAIVLFILFHQSLFLGKGLLATDGIFLFSPWRQLGEHKISNFLLADQYLYLNPQQHLLHTQMQQARLALWNPYLACGMPTAASMQPAAFFPLNLTLLWLDPFIASGLGAFLKLFLAGFFTLLYMRRLGVGQLAATLSAAVFSMCSFMIVWLGHPHTNCAMWLPLLLYFIEGEFQETESTLATAAGNLRASLRRWAGFSVVYAFMIFGGHPPTIVHVSLVVAVYFFFRLIFGCRGQLAGRRTILFFCSIGCGVLLAAPQVLPFLEYYRQSSVPLCSAAINRWARHLHVSAFAYGLMPYIAGSPNRGFVELMQFARPNYNFNERTIFIGIVPMCLSVFAAVFRRNRIVVFYFVLLLCCLAAICGVWPILPVLGHIPILSGINHMRLILVVCFSLAVLAGFGLEGLSRTGTSARLKVAAGLLVLAGAFVFWIVGRFRPVLAGHDSEVRAFVLSQLHVFCVSVVAAVFIILYPWHRGKKIPKILALVWVCFELLWFAMDYNPSIRREAYYPKTPSVSFLQQDDSLFRIASLDGVLPVNTAVMFGLYDIRGQDFMTVRRYEELVTGSAGKFFFYVPENPLPCCLKLLNVKYLLTDKDRLLPLERVYQDEIAIYRNEPFIDRAIVVYDYEVLPEKASILEIVRSEDFDPRKRLLLEQQPELPDCRGEPAADVAEPNVRIVAYGTDEVTIEAATPRTGFLVLLDTCFPGWRAFVDNKETRIYRADYNFRAVALPAGRTTVRFVYKPASFSVGCSLSLACVILLACAIFYRW